MFCDYPNCISHHIPSKSLTIHPNHWPWSECMVIHLATYPSKWSEEPGAVPPSLPTGKASLYLSFRDVSEMYRGATAVFQVVLATHAELSISQASVSSSSVSWSQGSPHNHRCRLGKRRQYKRRGVHGHLDHFMPLTCYIYIQSRLWTNCVHPTSIWWWNVDMYTQL